MHVLERPDSAAFFLDLVPRADEKADAPGQVRWADSKVRACIWKEKETTTLSQNASRRLKGRRSIWDAMLGGTHTPQDLGFVSNTHCTRHSVLRWERVVPSEQRIQYFREERDSHCSEVVHASVS